MPDWFCAEVGDADDAFAGAVDVFSGSEDVFDGSGDIFGDVFAGCDAVLPANVLERNNLMVDRHLLDISFPMTVLV